MPDDDRLIEIETKLAFQDRALAKFQEALLDQQKQLDRLSAQVERLRGKVAAGPVDDLSNEPPPPHYREPSGGM